MRNSTQGVISAATSTHIDQGLHDVSNGMKCSEVKTNLGSINNFAPSELCSSPDRLQCFRENIRAEVGLDGFEMNISGAI